MIFHSKGIKFYIYILNYIKEKSYYFNILLFIKKKSILFIKILFIYLFGYYNFCFNFYYYVVILFLKYKHLLIRNTYAYKYENLDYF